MKTHGLERNESLCLLYGQRCGQHAQPKIQSM
jgi:hypothetical protein